MPEAKTGIGRQAHAASGQVDGADWCSQKHVSSGNGQDVRYERARREVGKSMGNVRQAEHPN